MDGKSQFLECLLLLITFKSFTMVTKSKNECIDLEYKILDIKNSQRIRLKNRIIFLFFSSFLLI